MKGVSFVHFLFGSFWMKNMLVMAIERYGSTSSQTFVTRSLIRESVPYDVSILLPRASGGANREAKRRRVDGTASQPKSKSASEQTISASPPRKVPGRDKYPSKSFPGRTSTHDSHDSNPDNPTTVASAPGRMDTSIRKRPIRLPSRSPSPDRGQAGSALWQGSADAGSQESHRSSSPSSGSSGRLRSGSVSSLSASPDTTMAVGSARVVGSGHTMIKTGKHPDPLYSNVRKYAATTNWDSDRRKVFAKSRTTTDRGELTVKGRGHKVKVRMNVKAEEGGTVNVLGPGGPMYHKDLEQGARFRKSFATDPNGPRLLVKAKIGGKGSASVESQVVSRTRGPENQGESTT